MKILQKVFLLLAILVIFSGTFYVIFHNKPSQMQVVLGGKTFVMEIADTPDLHAEGLSGHKPLADNEGMIFIFDTPGVYKFWMKDMLFPLDIIWLAPDKTVVGFEKSLSPQTYPQSFGPDALSQYVLEISNGQIDNLNIKIGDTVNFTEK